jgi:Tfp pilus assembly protein PilN
LIRINLLPRAPRRGLPGRQFIQIGLPLVVLAAVIVTSIFLLSRNLGLERDLADTNKQIADLQPKVTRVLELERQIAVMRDKEKVIATLLGQQLPAASILNEFRLLIPKEVWATSINVPEPSALSVEGLAMNYHAVAQLMDNLATGQLFRLVDLTLVQLDHVGPKEVVKFQVTAHIQKIQAVGGERP